MQNENNTRTTDISFISPLSDNIDLVRRNTDGLFMIRRTSSADSFGVMKALEETAHPELMKVYDAQLMNGRCISLCEFVNGVTLARHLELNGIMSEEDAGAVVYRLCGGLSALHEKGIIHRDIKPENIMLTADGGIKLIDYDIAREYRPGSARDTEAFGTAGFASPEQFGFSQTTPASDVYSCGVLLNLLITGKLPNEELCTGKMRDIVLRCTEMDARKRFASAKELQRAIRSGRAYSFGLRPLPGFRGKNPLIKLAASILIALWFILLIRGIQLIPSNFGKSFRSDIQQIITYLDIFVLWTALPYFMFGDIFHISERISPDDPKKGRFIARGIAIAGIIAGAAALLISFIP